MSVSLYEIRLFSGLAIPTHALAVVLSVALSLWLVRKSWRGNGYGAGAFALWAALCVALGFFLGHLCHGLTHAAGTVGDKGFWYLFMPWKGNFMLYGAALGCLLATLLTARITRLSTASLCDMAAPGAALLVTLCRFSEGLMENCIGLGSYIEEEAHCFFPFAVLDPHYDEWFGAVFMLEGAYALVMFLALCRQKSSLPFDRTLLLALGYASGQIVLESLRSTTLRWGFVRCSQLVSAVLALAVVLLYALRDRAPRRALRASLYGAGALCALGVCLVMEFALEKRVAFLEELSRGHCYAVMTVAAAGLIALGLCARRGALRRLAQKDNSLQSRPSVLSYPQ